MYEQLKKGNYNFRTSTFEIYLNYNTPQTICTYGSVVLTDMPVNSVILLMPETTHHDRILSSSSDGYLISFLLDFPYTPNTVEVFRADNAFTMRALFDHFAVEWCMKKPGYKLRCSGILYQILDELRRRVDAPYTNSRSYRLIAPAYEYLHAHYKECSLNVELLASLCGITPQYLRKLFLEYFGVGPHKCINDLRMKLALDYLTSGKYSVNRAALESGFNDPNNFSRSFREYYGYPPSKAPKE